MLPYFSFLADVILMVLFNQVTLAVAVWFFFIDIFCLKKTLKILKGVQQIIILIKLSFRISFSVPRIILDFAKIFSYSKEIIILRKKQFAMP